MTMMLDLILEGVTARVLYELCFSTNAPLPLFQVHRKQGDRDIKFTDWVVKESKTPDFITKQRDVQFKMDIIGSPIGPPVTRVNQVHTVIFQPNFADGMLVVETLTQAVDVPFGDLMYQYTRWVVEDAEEGNACRIRISFGVHFLDNPWKLRPLKSTIMSRSVGDSKKFYVAWADVVTKWVKENPSKLCLLAGLAGQSCSSAAPIIGIQTPESKFTKSPSLSASIASTLPIYRRWWFPPPSVLFSSFCLACLSLMWDHQSFMTAGKILCLCWVLVVTLFLYTLEQRVSNGQVLQRLDSMQGNNQLVSPKRSMLSVSQETHF